MGPLLKLFAMRAWQASGMGEQAVAFAALPGMQLMGADATAWCPHCRDDGALLDGLL